MSNKRFNTILGQFSDEKQKVVGLKEQKTLFSNSSSIDKIVKQKSDDDIVIVDVVRTPLTKARRGGLKDTDYPILLKFALKGIVEKTGIDPKLVEDICVGTVLGQSSKVANEVRMAAFLAGFPVSTAVSTVNRQCSSGSQAIATIAAAIKSGHIKIGIAAGCESMSSATFRWTGSQNEEVKANKLAAACDIPMGLTSENVASKYGITREEQDKFALLSHKRAYEATKSGKFKDEIIPVKTTFIDRKTKEKSQVVLTKDGGIRPNISLEQLGKLRAVFKKDGSTTAGNASQLTDGSAAALIMTRATAKDLGLDILGVFRGFQVSGVPPHIMGIGPAVAIPDLCKKMNIKPNDVELYEINEAFASQAVYCVKKLGLSTKKVNLNGGAIAIGHPLGCTGVRMTATLLYEMKRNNQKSGIVSMCIGSGLGAATLLTRD